MVTTKSQYKLLGAAASLESLDYATRHRKMTKSISDPAENFSKEEDGDVVAKENVTTEAKIDGLVTGFVGLQNSFDQFFEFLKQNSPQKKRVSKGRSDQPDLSDDPSSSDDEDDD